MVLGGGRRLEVLEKWSSSREESPFASCSLSRFGSRRSSDSPSLCSVGLHPSDLHWLSSRHSLQELLLAGTAGLLSASDEHTAAQPLFFLPVSCEAFREVVCMKDSA